MSTNANQKQHQARVQQMLAGWAKPGVFVPGSITVRGQVLTAPQAQQQVQAFLNLLQAPDRAMVVYRAAVAARRAGSKAGWQFFDDLASVVTQHYGDHEAHERFGIPLPKKPALPSVETRVLANDQRQKTRQARGIRGRRQREALTGPKEKVVIVEAAADVPTAAKAKDGAS